MTNIVESVGWLGTCLLAVCGLPQLVKSRREGHSHGISWLFILAWFFGEILLFVYILSENKGFILLFNYLLNLFFAGGILYFKVFPRKDGSANG